MTMPLNVNCWVLNKDATHIFSVEIDCSKNVGDLKKAIKEEKKVAFDRINANSLLFK